MSHKVMRRKISATAVKRVAYFAFTFLLCLAFALSAIASTPYPEAIIEELPNSFEDEALLIPEDAIAPDVARNSDELEDPDAQLIVVEEDEQTAKSTASAKGPLNVINCVLLLAAGAFCAVFMYAMGHKNRSFSFKSAVPVALCLALAIRIVVAAASPGHSTDMGCFGAWANTLAENGTGSFYTSGMFADYPPGYLYILYVVGLIAKLFGFDLSSAFGSVFLRLTAMLCDVFIGLLLYRSFKKRSGEKRAFSLLLLAVMNPVSILNSAAWGQVDSVLALLVLAVFLLLRSKKLLPAAALYGLAVLVKPQALIVGPVFAVAYIIPFFGGKAGLKRASYDLALGVAIALGVIFVGSLPFKGTQSTFYLVDRYVATATSYPYASVNAFNLYSLLGANWSPQSNSFLFLTWGQWGTLGIVVSAVVTLCLIIISVKRRRLNLPLCAAVFLALVFALGHNMHERYMYPVLALLLASYGSMGDRRLKTSYAVLSGALFINIAAVLVCAFYNQYNLMGEGMDIAVRVFSAVMLCATGYFVFTAFDVCSYAVPPKDVPKELLSQAIEAGANGKDALVQHEAYTHESQEDDEAANEYDDTKTDEEHSKQMDEKAQARRTAALARLVPAKKHPSWTTKERLLLLALTFAYAVVAFLNLGDTDAPQSYYAAKDADRVMVTLPDGSEAVSVWTYGGISNGRLAVYAADGSSGTLAGTADVNYDVMFRWHITELSEHTNKYMLKAFSDVWLNELVFVDADGKAIEPVSIAAYEGDTRTDDSPAMALFDEQAKKPDVPSAQNGMYFDELYHGRTALEHLLGLKPYENSHPPLGKVFIMTGIAIFGMTPFGWRFAGALFGVLMLPALYLLARRITRSSKWSFFATALFAVDFMHFSQTRIATIDVFVVFFIILMYYFMYRYTELNFHTDGLKKTLTPLALSGVCFGLGASSKWTGIYAGLGLAVIFFLTLFKRYREYKAARESQDEAAMAQTADFTKNTVLTLAFCVGFFVIVPVVIYLLSYLPYFLCAEAPYDLKGVWGVQEFMFGYHSGLTATHPYESRWYTWPLNVRPIWYYSGSSLLPEGTISSISAFGNPVVWLSGITGVFSLLLLRLKDKLNAASDAAVFLLIGFCAQFLPWVLISRATFIYHYFPSVPFIILALTLALSSTADRSRTSEPDLTAAEPKWIKVIRIALPVVAFALFIAFYPVLSGLPVSKSYASLLRWLPTWTFFI